MKAIPIVWGLDRKYILQAFVVMYSILRNSESCFEFILLSADNIGNDIMPYMARLKKKYENFSMRFIKICNEYFERADINNPHLTVAAYNRLLAAEYVTDYDKCIYLDCDLIVYGDIKSLYTYDVSNYYILGVKDCHIIENSLEQKKHQEDIGLKDKNTYINSGVLVMNLKKIREDGLIYKFLTQSQKYNKFEDQDVLNVCCYGKIGVLPLQYNLFHFYQGISIKFLFKLPYEEREFRFNWDKPVILHMGNKYKPWYNYKVKGSKEWWKLADIFQGCEGYDVYKELCGKCNDETLSDLIRTCKKHENVVIWGFSKNGKKIFDIMRESGVNNVRAFADNNVQYIGEEYRNIPVMGFRQIQKSFCDIMWVISCQKAYPEVLEQLLENSVKDKNIMKYSSNTKGIFYYLALDEVYYAEELDEIAICEYIDKIADKETRKKYIKDLLIHPEISPDEYVYLNRKYFFEQWLFLNSRGLN